MDIAMLAVGVGFFALIFGYISACERLWGDAPCCSISSPAAWSPPSSPSISYMRSFVPNGS